jgi:hypothetical protein
MGIITAVTAVVAALVYLVARFGDFTIFGYNPGDVPGFSTLIIAILFFSGVQLISVGILGEYLGRLYQEVKMRPTYIVKEMRGLNSIASARNGLASYRVSNFASSDETIQRIYNLRQPKNTKNAQAETAKKSF